MMVAKYANSAGQRIAVFGAAGHTGRFVMFELARRGLVPVGIGRDPGKLAKAGFRERGFETRATGMDVPASLDRVLAGTCAVINCAGPFLDTAGMLVAAAMRAGIHYLDVTAEQASALDTFERFDTPARKNGLVVIPAMGFYGGLTDLLVTACMDEWDVADDVRIAIALSSWHPTEGTRRTGERNKVPRVVIDDGKLVRLVDPSSAGSWEFPEPFGTQEIAEVPFTEMILIARHLRVSNAHTYLNLAPLRDLSDAATPQPTPVDDSGRSAQQFLVDVRLRNGANTRRGIARGQDIYAVTAPLVVEAAQRIAEGQVRSRGVLAPGQAFDAKDFLRALSPQHLIWG